MQTILELQNVVKNYGRTPVLGGVSMEVKEGEIQTNSSLNFPGPKRPWQ